MGGLGGISCGLLLCLHPRPCSLSPKSPLLAATVSFKDAFPVETHPASLLIRTRHCGEERQKTHWEGENVEIKA